LVGDELGTGFPYGHYYARKEERNFNRNWISRSPLTSLMFPSFPSHKPIDYTASTTSTDLEGGLINYRAEQSDKEQLRGGPWISLKSKPQGNMREGMSAMKSGKDFIYAKKRVSKVIHSTTNKKSPRYAAKR
jgi:hypothetical protein